MKKKEKRKRKLRKIRQKKKGRKERKTRKGKKERRIRRIRNPRSRRRKRQLKLNLKDSLMPQNPKRYLLIRSLQTKLSKLMWRHKLVRISLLRLKKKLLRRKKNLR